MLVLRASLKAESLLGYLVWMATIPAYLVGPPCPLSMLVPIADCVLSCVPIADCVLSCVLSSNCWLCSELCSELQSTLSGGRGAGDKCFECEWEVRRESLYTTLGKGGPSILAGIVDYSIIREQQWKLFTHSPPLLNSSSYWDGHPDFPSLIGPIIQRMSSLLGVLKVHQLWSKSGTVKIRVVWWEGRGIEDGAGILMTLVIFSPKGDASRDIKT